LNEHCRIFIISVENNENAYTDPIGNVIKIAGIIPYINGLKYFINIICFYKFNEFIAFSIIEISSSTNNISLFDKVIDVIVFVLFFVIFTS
jgi:hypothetical protein